MNSNSRTKNTILNLVTGVGGQIIQVLLKFITRTIFIQVLGTVYLGINGLFTDILTLLSISELGFDTAINYKFYKPLAEKDEKRLRILIKFYKYIYISVGTTVFIVGLCLIPFLKYIIKDYDLLGSLGINAVLIFLLYLFQSASTYWFFTYKAAVVKADQKGYLLNWAQIIVTLISNIAQIIILLTLRDFIAYTIVIVAFTIIENAVYARIASVRYPSLFIKEESSVTRHEVIDTFKDCGALLVYKVNGVVTRATGNILLSTFIGIVIVGLYSNYLLIYNTINTLLNRFYEACKASMGNVFAVSDLSKSYYFFQVMNFITSILYGTAAIGISVLSNEFINLWIGDEYILAQPIPMLIGVEIYFAGIRNNLGQVRNVTGVFRQMWFRPVLGIIINLCVSIVLVQKIRIAGILIGVITANILTNFLVDPYVIHKYSFNNYKPSSVYYKKNIGYIALLVVDGVMCFFVCQLLNVPNSWASIIVHTGIVLLLVPSSFILLLYNTEPCAYVRGFVTNIIKRVL